MGRKDPGKIRAGFSNLLLPAAWWVPSSSSPLLALRSYSSQLCAASLDPCLALLGVNGNGEATRPIHYQSTLLRACLFVASWGKLDMWLKLYTSLQRTKEGKSHLTHVTHARMPNQITLSLGTDV